LPADLAQKLAGENPDYAIQDLYNAIDKGNFPSWNLFIQLMTVAQADTFRYNPFDVTKVWSQKEFPLIPVGRLVLNRLFLLKSVMMLLIN
jgi:catalase